MISIDRVYKTVLTLANSDIRGNVKPTDLRLTLYDVVNEIVEEYFYEVNRMLNRENRGLINGGFENIPDRIREKILHFLKEDVALPYVTPYFVLPTDLRYIDSVFYLNENEVEFCKHNKEFKLLLNYADTLPSVKNPIGLRVGDKIKIAPTAIKANVTISYLRNPKVPNWTYTVVGGAELFNPSAPDFQDIDLHPSEENRVILGTLKRFGINLKENDLTQMTASKEATDFNQDNAS
jgi:hypothetical protein